MEEEREGKGAEFATKIPFPRLYTHLPSSPVYLSRTAPPHGLKTWGKKSWRQNRPEIGPKSLPRS